MHSDFEELLCSFTESTRRAINDERLESLDALNQVPCDDLVDILGLRPHDLRNLEWYRNPLTRAWKSFVLSSPSVKTTTTLGLCDEVDITAAFLSVVILPTNRQEIRRRLIMTLSSSTTPPSVNDRYSSWPQVLFAGRSSDSSSDTDTNSLSEEDNETNPASRNLDKKIDLPEGKEMSLSNVCTSAATVPWGLAHTICLDSEPGRALPLADILFPPVERSSTMDSSSYTLLKSYTIGEWVDHYPGMRGSDDGDHYPDQLLDKAWVRQCLHELGMRGADDSVSVFLHLAALTMSPYLQALLGRSVLVEHLLSDVPFVFSRIPSQIAWPEGTSERRDAVWAWVAAVQQRAMWVWSLPTEEQRAKYTTFSHASLSPFSLATIDRPLPLTLFASVIARMVPQITAVENCTNDSTICKLRTL